MAAVPSVSDEVVTLGGLCDDKVAGPWKMAPQLTWTFWVVLNFLHQRVSRWTMTHQYTSYSGTMWVPHHQLDVAARYNEDERAAFENGYRAAIQDVLVMVAT